MFRLYDDDLNPETNANPLEPPRPPEEQAGNGLPHESSGITSKMSDSKAAGVGNSGKEPRTKLQTFKMTLSAGGILNCLGMLIMAGMMIIHLDQTDFFSVCYSLSQAMLFFAAAVFVFIMEGRFIFPRESDLQKNWRQKLSVFLFNKLGLGVFYFWIGALIMGGKNYTHESQRTLGRCIGVLSWVLFAGNILTSCAMDRATPEGEAADRQAIGKPLDTDLHFDEQASRV
ncbi:unnamed protein product [Amoebophrya sp. A120]|nr:unnamed protein product [Amoebophrya sp. A120]|eukprot:GSA120T00008325001.1